MQNETGNPDFKYELACTEICGRGHFAMRFIVVVDEPEEYEAWLAEQQPFIELNPDLMAKFTNKAQAALEVEKKTETPEVVK
jgi:cytochrome c oxidase subunit II